MQLPKAILFDADGTLYDSERLNYEANRLTAKDLHDFDLTWELFDEHVRRGAKSGYQVLEDHGIDVDGVAYNTHKLTHHERLILEQLKPRDGLIDFLEWCKVLHIRCFIVSSGRRTVLEIALQATGIAKYFEAIVSREDVGDKHKPHPHPYQYALQLAKLSSDEAIALEDTAKGIASAQAAGLRCIGIRNKENEGTDELNEANHIINTYTELQIYLTT